MFVTLTLTTKISRSMFLSHTRDGDLRLGRSPADAGRCFRPRFSPVTSGGIARRAGVWLGTRPSAFQHHSPTRPSPRIRFSVRTTGDISSARPAGLAGSKKPGYRFCSCARAFARPTKHADENKKSNNPQSSQRLRLARHPIADRNSQARENARARRRCCIVPNALAARLQRRAYAQLTSEASSVMDAPS